MAKAVAFIRGINVGGKVMVSMAALKELMEAMNLQNVRTVLNSGNVIFEARTRKASGIEKLLEDEIAKHFGVDVDVMVRGAAELQAVIEANPFSKEAKEDPSHLVVMFFRKAPGAAETPPNSASAPATPAPPPPAAQRTPVHQTSLPTSPPPAEAPFGPS